MHTVQSRVNDKYYEKNILYGSNSRISRNGLVMHV